MTIERYITIDVINVNGKLIPFWDQSLKWVDNSDYGTSDAIRVTGFDEYLSFQKAVFDLETKEISTGIVKELDILPSDKFIIGNTYLTEGKPSNHLKLQTLIDIVYNRRCDCVTTEGKNLDPYYIKTFFNETDPCIANQMYQLKSWYPSYVFDDGTIIDWEHSIYHLTNI